MTKSIIAGSAWGVAFLVAAQFGQVLAAGRGQAEAPTIPRVLTPAITSEPIVIDGVLEDAWANAVPGSGFIQKDPQVGVPATEQTEVRVLYDQSSIYVAVYCYDSDPSRIIAKERRRDDPLLSDDTISIVLDTFHDHRNAFLFRTNPLATRYDGLISNEGADVNANWDENWQVASRIVEDGWIVEIELPLRILRIQPEDVQTWGIDFERVILRQNERTYWNNFSRDFEFEQVSQAGHLVDLQNLVRGTSWRIKPFGVTGFRSDNRRADRENLSEIGLEDLKYRVTSGLTAQATVNTDFAQTDVDDQRINLDRFSLFFPEKREFFLEGLGNFEIGARLQDDTADQTVRLFHSRRIGLSNRGEAIPIVGGGRLTGRVGDYTVGALQMWTDSFDSPLSGHTPASAYSVLRVKRDILDRSSVGMFISNRDSSDSFNRVYAVDTQLVFWSRLNFSGFAAASETSGTRDDELSASARVFWVSDLFTAGAGHLIQQPNFQTDLGFTPRDDFKKSLLDVGVFPRPGWDGVRQLTFRTLLEYFTDNQNVVQTKNYEYSFAAEFESSDGLRFVYTDHFERVLDPFMIGDIVVRPGDYPSRRFNVEYVGARSRRITGAPLLEYLRGWGFWGGSRDIFRVRPVFRLSDRITFRPGYDITGIRIDPRRLTIHVLNSRLDYTFTNKWLTSLIVQRNSLDRATGFNVRLNYIYRGGDNFFIIYNRLDNRLTGFEQDGLILNFTHSFDF